MLCYKLSNLTNFEFFRLHMKIHDAQQLRTIEQALPAGAKTQYKDMNKFFCEICNKRLELFIKTLIN